MDRIERALAETAETTGVIFIQMSDLIDRGSLMGLIGGDKVHPTQVGRKLFADQLAAVLEDAGVEDHRESR